MKDSTFASNLRKSMDDDSSTDNLIKIVGEVLKTTKSEGSYQGWMQESFETARVTNKALADTLKKLLITQDVLATTNYDLLLEQATGLKTLSYEEPDQAFAMIDKRKSDSVLHLHGVYDSAHGIDNIVADQIQYDAVLNDKGAQFIQNILGTRTLIFVGCGQTTEDGNISQFIQFAKTKWVMYGARQGAKYDPFVGGGIPEVDLEADFMREMFDYIPQEPYRRTNRKIGANEPCPCGSGKKFKKCCRGNGKYD